MKNITSWDEVHTLMDEVLANVPATLAAEGEKLACKAGCFYCCKETVISTNVEVDYIVSKLTDEQRSELTPKVEAWLNVAVANMDILGLEPSESEPYPILKYRALNLWCPALKDGLCSIYNNRPVECRAFLKGDTNDECKDDAKRIKGNEEEGKFLTVPEMYFPAAAMLKSVDVDEVYFDHFGLLLANALLGRTIRSPRALTLRRAINSTNKATL